MYVKANLGSGHMLSRPVRGSIVLHSEMVQIFTAVSLCRLMGRYPVLCVSSLFILLRWKTMSLSGPVQVIVCEQEGKNEVIVQMFWSHIRPSVTNRHVFVINTSKREPACGLI